MKKYISYLPPSKIFNSIFDPFKAASAAIVIRFRFKVPGGERLGDFIYLCWLTAAIHVMQPSDAIALIQHAITSEQSQRWADLGCGSGTFTMALKSVLPAGSDITAVDKQTQNLSVDFLKADFAKDKLPFSNLNGILMANSIHYIRDKQKLIRKLEAYFSSDPLFLIVEYDTTRYSPWRPYPVNYAHLHQLFTSLGYSNITRLAEAPSRFGGRMYSALIRL